MAVATLTACQPLPPDSQDRLAFVYHHWAILLEQQEKHEDAQRAMDQARAIWEQLAAAEEAVPNTALIGPGRWPTAPCRSSATRTRRSRWPAV